MMHRAMKFLSFYIYFPSQSPIVIFHLRPPSLVQWQRTGLQVNRLSDRSYTRGMIHNKINLISPDCPQPSIALQWPKTPSFHFIFIYMQYKFSVFKISIPYICTGSIFSIIGRFLYVVYSLLKILLKNWKWRCKQRGKLKSTANALIGI